MKCLHVRCDNDATSLVVPTYGTPWRGCDEHAPAMSAALGGTTKPIGEAAAKTGNSWDNREGPTWIDQL